MREEPSTSTVLSTSKAVSPPRCRYPLRGISRIPLRDTTNLFPPKIRPPGPHDHIPATCEPETLARLDTDLRRIIRLKNMAVATEQTYCQWSTRFSRFCFRRIGQSPADAGPPAVTA